MGGPPSTGKSKQLKGLSAALTGTGPYQTGPKVIEPAQGEFRLELSIFHQGKATFCVAGFGENVSRTALRSPPGQACYQ